MLQVFVSNRYDALFAKLKESLSSQSFETPFQFPTLVTGTKFIADKLKRDIASDKGICAGIEFQSQQIWQARTMGTARQTGAEALSLVWTIWQVLSDRNFVNQHERLSHFLSQSDDLAKFQLSQRIAETFSDYLRFRPDWMTQWLNGQDPIAKKDSPWQMALWQKVNALDSNFGKALEEGMIEENLADMPSPLHFFIPVSLQPTAIDALKEAALKHNKDITVYLYSGVSNKISDCAFIEKYGERLRDVINAFDANTIQFLNTTTKADSLLERLQEALWTGSTQNLPQAFNNDDQSVRIVCTVSHTREIENAVDLIHHWNNRGVKADEILVVAPDVKALAPTIHSVLSALPDDQSIAYRILSESAPAASHATAAFLGLGKLLSSRCTIEDFEAWLELPAASDAFGLNLDDLAVIKDWLSSAGFMYGINESHLARQGLKVLDESKDSNPKVAFDGTLFDAIKRLALGVVTDNTVELVGETLPVRKGQAFRFQTVESRRDLFKALLTIYQLFDGLLSQMPVHQALPDKWDRFSRKLLNAIVNKPSLKDNAIAIQTVLRNLSQSFKALKDQPLLPFEVYWKALESILTDPTQGLGIDGRVTFANMGTMRGLPYKVVIALGLEADSNFPGEQKYHEFHLMGQTDARQGDANRRIDSQSIFVDLLASTEKALILSFAGDKTKERTSPSIVVEDLASFANSQTGAAPGQWLSSLEATIGTDSVSMSNFSDDKKSGQYWKSGNAIALEALKKQVNDPQPELPLTEGGVDIEENPTLTYRELISYIKDPEAWAEKKLGLKVIEETSGEAPEFFGDQGFLAKYQFFTEHFARLQKGWNEADIRRLVAADPRNGAKPIRLTNREEDLNSVLNGSHLYSAIKSIRYKTQTEVPPFTIPKSSRFKTFRIDTSDLFELKEHSESEPSHELFVLCRSQTSLLWARFLHCAIVVAGYNVRELIICPENVKLTYSLEPNWAKDLKVEGWTLGSYAPPDCAQAVFDELISIYERALNDITAFSGGDKSYLGKTCPDKLWRGQDWKLAVEQRNHWQKVIETFIKLSDKNHKSAQKQTSKKTGKKAKK